MHRATRCPRDENASKGVRLLVLALLGVAILFAASCRPELVVRLSTRVYHDGSLDRRLEVTGRTAEGEVPTEDDWLGTTGGLRLAEPDAWGRVERGPGRLEAEGFFLAADDLPAVLTFQTESASKRARIRTRVEIDDRVILKRWVFSESHGDPYSGAESAAALDALVELAVEALREELSDHLGSDVDSTPAAELLRTKGRSLAAALLSVGRTKPGWEHMNERAENWTSVLSQHGVPVIAVHEPDGYWDEQLPVLLAWAREEVAAALSTAEAPIHADELAFWPMGEDMELQLTEMAQRVWGSEDELFRLVEPHIGALAGYYGGDNVPRYLFEVRASVPGVLLRTNGTVDGDSVVWIFRERQLTFGDFFMRAESVEAQAEPLTALGARREFDPALLVQLADLLWTQDPEGVLAELLRRGVRIGRFDILRDENEVPEELATAANELADLLDPAVPPRLPL